MKARDWFPANGDVVLVACYTQVRVPEGKLLSNHVLLPDKIRNPLVLEAIMCLEKHPLTTSLRGQHLFAIGGLERLEN
jgi:hypothetical protein